MDTQAHPNLELAHRYLALLQRKAGAPEFEELFAPEFKHREFPNRLNPEGRSLNRAQLLAGVEKAARILIEQHYGVRHAIVQGDDLALEVAWSGSFNIAFGNTPAGQPLRASFGMFLSFKDGKIVSQRNYDCFEPF
jgi:ketosteroid isomerase-like protein